jgi:phosphate starvation-inducible PhoH-like protein
MGTFMARKKRETTERVEHRTEDMGISSVYFYADRDLTPKIFAEDITRIKKAFQVRIDLDDDKFTISSPNLEHCRKSAIVLERMFNYIDKYDSITEEELTALISALNFRPLEGTKYRNIYTTPLGDNISPRTDNQELLIKGIRNNVITIVHGCAGTGKSKLSLVMGLKYIEENRYDKIIIVRPMVTVGASLGFLPGSVAQKYGPFASPIYDALTEMIGERDLEIKIKSKKIEFAPVGFTRGANFQNAYIIIDEAQNLSKVEMLTLLTRVGYNTKIVVTGDESQTDRRSSDRSGLEYCVERLKDIDDVGFVKMGRKDVQRHKIVSDIIEGFES